MLPDKDYNLTVGLRIREIREACNMTRAEFSEKCDISADYFIRGRKNGFESDMLTEMFSSMDKNSREAGIRMLREYVSAINHLSNLK